MARKVGMLSPLFVRRVTKPGAYNDGGGLYLQVDRGGSTSWIFRYGAQGRRWHGLGPLHTVTLAEAREKARDCRKLLLEGRDPIAESRDRKTAAKLEAARSITFMNAAEEFIKSHEATWKSPRNAEQWRASLRDHAFPVIGKLPVAAIDTALVMRVLTPIWSEKCQTASRVRMRVERVLHWAKVRGHRDGENPARWRHHLDKLLPSQSKVAPVRHHRALPYVELPSFLVELREREGLAALALEFLILTAARTNEVLGATWAEIDFTAALWTVPASRMKSGREHRVPLSAPAISLLRSLPRDGDRVFPLAASTILQMLSRRMGRDLTVHGFRSSFCDWASECTDNPREVVEMALAHAVEDKVEAAYRRGDLFAKRRQLMDAWGDFCCTPEAISSSVAA